MAALPSFASIYSNITSQHRHVTFRRDYRRKVYKIRCNGEDTTSSSSTTRKSSEPENALLKVAWYGSELLGIAASFFRSSGNAEASILELAIDGEGAIHRALVVETIKNDFERSYFVTGFLKLNCFILECLLFNYSSCTCYWIFCTYTISSDVGN